MTDLLTPSDADRAGDSGASDDATPRRSFRAATLDEAVAAARAELGPEVELIEAHRVRRGGLGGFFATDLGVEIIAAANLTGPVSAGLAPALPTTPITPPLSVPAIQPVPAGDPVLPVAPASAEVVTALDRLIQHAESIDRSIPIEHADRVPALSMADDLDPLWLSDDAQARATDPTSFEAHLQSEMAAIITPRPERATAAPPIVDRAPIVDDDPTAEVGRPTMSTDEPLTADIWCDEPMPAASIEPISDDIVEIDTFEDEAARSEELTPTTEEPTDPTGEIDPAGVDDVMATDLLGPADEDVDAGAIVERSTSAALAPPSALLNPALANDDEGATDDGVDASIEELDALLREVGIMVDAVDAPPIPAPVTMSSLSTIESLTRVAAEQLLDGVAAIERHPAERISRLSVSVTAPDGTTVTVASDLLESMGQPVMLDALVGPFETEGNDG